VARKSDCASAKLLLLLPMMMMMMEIEGKL